jgi:hypothetical protein
MLYHINEIVEWTKDVLGIPLGTTAAVVVVGGSVWSTVAKSCSPELTHGRGSF